ncbi:hypothetical protein RCH06_000773 [Polaromonas sp. CG_9.5]|nr:hypothetical protein [Polaromonas sp. CG_9.5]
MGVIKRWEGEKEEEGEAARAADAVQKMPETAVDCRLLTLAHRKITRKKSGRSPGSRVNKQMACLPDPLPMRWHSGDGSGFDSFTVARAASEWRGLTNNLCAPTSRLSLQTEVCRPPEIRFQFSTRKLSFSDDGFHKARISSSITEKEVAIYDCRRRAAVLCAGLSNSIILDQTGLLCKQDVRKQLLNK